MRKAVKHATELKTCPIWPRTPQTPTGAGTVEGSASCFLLFGSELSVPLRAAGQVDSSNKCSCIFLYGGDLVQFTRVPVVTGITVLQR